MNQKAFTLLELIIVILIIGILATLAIPQYVTLKEKAIAAEAIRLLGAWHKDNMLRVQMGETVNPVPPTTTKYWEFNGQIVMHLPESYLEYYATRTDGAYKDTVIFMSPYEAPNIWRGNHPGVPKNPE